VELLRCGWLEQRIDSSVGAPPVAEGVRSFAAMGSGLLCGAGRAPRRTLSVFFTRAIGCGCGAKWGG
jgi:hypothetical protein